MPSWLTPLRRTLAALRAPARPATRRPAAAPRPARLALTELERRELMDARAYVIPQNYPGYESDYINPSAYERTTSSAGFGYYAAICIGLTEALTGAETGTVDWETVGVSARAGSDYTAAAGTVSFTAGTNPWAYVFVPLINDAKPEPTEVFSIRLSNPTGAVTLGAADTTIRVLDDDTSGATLSPVADLRVGPVCPQYTVPAAAAGAPDRAIPRPATNFPVRYADGVLTYAADDLGGGTAVSWGLQRSWTNGAGYAAHPDGGNGWVLTETPFLVQQAAGYDDTLAVVTNGTTARFFDLVGSSYAARGYDTSALAHDATSDLFTLTDGTGATVTFYDFSSTWVAGQRGRFAGYQTAGGTAVSVVSSDGSGRPTEVQEAVTTGGVTTTDSYVLAYSGSGAGTLDSVLLRRKVGAGAWGAVRSVEYAYYDGVESHGNLGDLKTATVKDASGTAVSADYYRYYTAGEPDGYAGGLKLVVSGEGYARAVAALGAMDTGLVTDAQVGDYAAYLFEYDGSRRVTREVVGGAGCSVCSGGMGAFDYAYTASSNPVGFNSWAMKTVETRPDGSTNTVYTNAFGQVMLEAVSDGGSVWRTYHRYDGAGRLVLSAAPSAVTGYSDSYADLVDGDTGNATYLSDSAGLLTAYTYAASTTATTSAAGDAAGYLKAVAIRQGETGTAVPQSAVSYIKNTANSIDFFHVASATAYRNDNGTGGQTTSYAYTFASGTNQVASATVTLPAVTAAQNGSNAATSATTVNDAFGRPVWSKDPAGFITYAAYDGVTGAVAKTIADVDTTQTSTFANLPSGWSTPSGGGLHLTTSYEADALGRTTKATAPNGRIDYTVYDDVNHAVRSYAGWNTSTNTPTGPTVVSRADRANGYTESLTMSAAPGVSSGRPTGGESIGSVQSLSRSYTNEAGQVTHADAYFNLSGLTYSTSTSLGTEGTHFYRTRYQYDNTGAVKRVLTPEGTVSRTVRDGLGRVTSEWAGTDDTPTTGFWSPANTTGTNLVKVAEYEYDGGGAGDGNLTTVTQFPGGGAARVTQTWFDWRNRAVATKAGVEASESTGVNRPLAYYDYDNLGSVTKTRVYDADGVTPSVTGGVPQPLSSGLLRAQTTAAFDELGRAYRTDTYSVDPSSGTVGSDTLYSEAWFDSRGNVIKTGAPGGLVQKTSYDGAGRATATYATDGGGDTGYGDADDVTGDTVLEQVEWIYDTSGNVQIVTARQRFHDASGTGALGTPTNGVAARVSYVGYTYDKADRPAGVADMGTNGGSHWMGPYPLPTPSATARVTATRYATDAVQAVALTGGPTGGTFTLAFGGYTTSALAYNASAATIQTALTGLTSIGSGNVAVTAAPGGGGWEVRFTGTLADSYQPAITGGGAGLTGGTSPAVAVSTVNAGGDAGGAAETTDPAGREWRAYADALGRTVRTVQNFVDGVVSDADDKTTGYAYNGAGMTSLTAYLTGGGGQTTQYVYGVTQAGGNGIDSNDAVGATRWPDPTTGAASGGQQETTTVNALGQALTMTDRNGSVHALTYDVLGRVVSDAVTTLSGVDGSVRRVETAFDGQGNAYLVTSYDAASGGSVVNQVQRAFNGLGQLITEWQAHGGAVNTSTSPKVQYAWSEMPSGANHSRLTSMTYPDGYVLTHNYASGLNGDISRLSSLSDSTGAVEAYSYLGAGTVVVRAHAQPGVDLTYVKRSGESNADAGDQYTGLDRFGRVVDQRWLNPSTGTATDRFQYGYDAAGNRTFRDNLVNSAFGELYAYDGLDQLASFDRGTLDGPRTGLTGAASRAQDWDYDAVGNFDGVTTNGTAQARTANAQNEITGIGGATTPTYDASGNMTGDETGRQFVYDGWNRLVAVKNSGGTTLKTYAYDGLTRRVSETAGGTTTDLYYSADWQVLAEKSGAATTRYVWSPVYVDAMILRDRDTNADGTTDERLWVQQDANWNVTALVDGSGVVVERYVYDPYGVRKVYDASWSSLGSSAYLWSSGFQGMFFDSTAGLSNQRMRWYSPTLGRWVTMDPIRYSAGDVNLYVFAGNSPIDHVDPTGLQYWGGQQVDPKAPVKPREVRVWLTFGEDDISDWAAGWHSGYATANSVIPGTRKQVTERGNSLKEVVDKLKKQLGPNDCISYLQFSGHGGAGDWYLRDGGPEQLDPALVGAPGVPQKKLKKTIVLDHDDIAVYLAVKNGASTAILPQRQKDIIEALDYLRSKMCAKSDIVLKICHQADGDHGASFCRNFSVALDKYVYGSDAMIGPKAKGNWWLFPPGGEKQQAPGNCPPQ